MLLGDAEMLPGLTLGAFTVTVVVIAVVGVVGAEWLRLDGDVIVKGVRVHWRGEVDREAGVGVSIILPVKRVGADDSRQRDGAEAPLRLPFQRRAAASLLSSRGALLPTSVEAPTASGDDFDLVTWLVIMETH